jgi:hypothetical protein
LTQANSHTAQESTFQASRTCHPAKVEGIAVRRRSVSEWWATDVTVRNAFLRGGCVALWEIQLDSHVRFSNRHDPIEHSVCRHCGFLKLENPDDRPPVVAKIHGRYQRRAPDSLQAWRSTTRGSAGTIDAPDQTCGRKAGQRRVVVKISLWLLETLASARARPGPKATRVSDVVIIPSRAITDAVRPVFRSSDVVMRR